MASSPYSTVVPLARPIPSHVTDTDDQARVRAYTTYEDIWNNVPEAFTALLRESDDPISRRYLPLVRDIVEAVNRYLAVDMETTWTALPGSTVSDDQMKEWRGRLDAFWAREEVAIKMMSNKRWGLIKGDAIIHVHADASKAEGSRVSISEIEPDQYFPIYDPANAERVIGCYLASIVLDDEGEEIVQRIEYRKVLSEEQAGELGAPIGTVFYRMGYFEPDGWDERDPEVTAAPVDPPEWAAAADGAPDPFTGYPLDPQITSIPVYHFRNKRRGGKAGRFGVSEIQGLESIYAGIIQNATDEDLAVAMVGLGVYWTDSGKARDSQGNEVAWEVGPASIAELEKDGKFGRVPGITTVQPILDHIKLLEAGARGASAAPLIASGNVDASVAASGVALRIQFMPTLAANAEKEQELASRWTHVLFDLMTMWFPVYEGWAALPLQPGVVFGDPLPLDRTALITEVSGLVTIGIMSKEFAAEYLAEKLGYKFPEGMVEQAAAEQQATLDAEGARIAAEAGQVTGGDPEA
jgi:hypothetical protein